MYSLDNIYMIWNTTVLYIMPTKQELEDELNERLNLDLEWSKMNKGDLMTIRDGLEDEDFVKKFVAQYANTVTGKKVQDQIEGWEPGKGLRIINQLQKQEANPADFFM